MKLEKLFFSIGLFSLLFVFTQCENDDFTQDDVSIQATELSAKGGKPVGGETTGNNLSFPVIWADGVTKVVPGTMGTVTLTGEWWGVWGVDPIDPQAPLYSCGPYLTPDAIFCIESEYRAYVQKDPKNSWQAFNGYPVAFLDKAGALNVDLIDWGDNLESVDWTMTSQVRLEVALLENLNEAVTQYAMRHTDSWGIDEAHGLQTELALDSITGLPVPILADGLQATVYSDNARFTIQKLNVEARDDERLDSLVWVPRLGWTESDNEPVNLVNSPILNTKAGAEINVKGKIIYGSTWGVRTLNNGAGLYRITFSFDPNGNLNTFFDANTEIIVAIEEEGDVTIAAEDGDKGGFGKMDSTNNLTYLDILIVGKTTGSGGGGGVGGGGAGGGGGSGSGGGGRN